MNDRPSAVVPRPGPRAAAAGGFTLIELMIALAVIGILAALAYPNYRDHVLRGQLVDATNLLAITRAQMERYYQDNRTYQSLPGQNPPAVSPCEVPAAQRTVGRFVLSCEPGSLTATAYRLRVEGLGFVFTIDQADRRATAAAPAGWGTCGTGWVLRRGQACT